MDKYIQGEPKLRYQIFYKISKELDYLFKSSNIRCFDHDFPSLMDVFIHAKRIGSDSAYGKVYKACVNSNLMTGGSLRKKKCYNICDQYKNSDVKSLKKRCRRYKNSPFYVAIKIQPLSVREYESLKSVKKTGIMPWNNIHKNNLPLWREIFAHRLLTLLLKYNVVPTVPIMFEPYICYSCDNNHPCVIIINEFAKGDLHEWLRRKKRGNMEILSAFFQIFITLYAMQLNFRMIHNDLHWGNILYSKVKKKIWTFQINSTRNTKIATFNIPTEGNIFKITDLGRVDMSVKPISTHKLYFTDAYRVLHSLYGLENTDVIPPSSEIQRWAQAASDSIMVIMTKPKRPSINEFGRWVATIFAPLYLKSFNLPTFPSNVKSDDKWIVRKNASINRWVRDNITTNRKRRK